MDHYNFSAVKEEAVTDFGSTKTTIRILIEPNHAPNFIMRRFEIQPGGNIGIHNHWNEHEIYILAGEMDLLDKDGNKTHVVENDFVFMPPNELHGYLNESDKPVIFLCVVPKSK
ncbi:MAG: cupin domain-containing protein [Candidatus Lokiarchaeota archaeon]|nr:cupin domain-containing protein [Candidatus Lokiarchaeota archaeon]